MAGQLFWALASRVRFIDHFKTRHTCWDSSRRVIGPSQKSLPDNTQHSQERDIHGPDGI
jgi:hypothetical protein